MGGENVLQGQLTSGYCPPGIWLSRQAVLSLVSLLGDLRKLAWLVELGGGLGGGVQTHGRSSRGEAAQIGAISFDSIENSSENMQRVVQQLMVATFESHNSMLEQLNEDFTSSRHGGHIVLLEEGSRCPHRVKLLVQDIQGPRRRLLQKLQNILLVRKLAAQLPDKVLREQHAPRLAQRLLAR